MVTHSETARVFRKLEFHVAKQRSCRMPREKSIENDIEVAKKIMEVSAEMKSLVLYISRLRNHSYANEFDLHENETACRTRFHMKGLAFRLVLKQRHKRTRNLAYYCKERKIKLLISVYMEPKRN